jgi:hypothetical protein
VCFRQRSGGGPCQTGCRTGQRWEAGGGVILSGYTTRCLGSAVGEEEVQVVLMAGEDVARIEVEEDREDAGLTEDREATATATASRPMVKIRKYTSLLAQCL